MVLDLITDLMASTFAADVNDVAVMVKILVGGDDQSAPGFDSCMTVPHPDGAENGPLGKRRRELMADARQKVVSSVSRWLEKSLESWKITRYLDHRKIVTSRTSFSLSRPWEMNKPFQAALLTGRVAAVYGQKMLTNKHHLEHTIADTKHKPVQ